MEWEALEREVAALAVVQVEGAAPVVAEQEDQVAEAPEREGAARAPVQVEVAEGAARAARLANPSTDHQSLPRLQGLIFSMFQSATF
jgi:hypothetical protein